MVTRISQFEARSKFRTWAWRIVLGCFLNSKRARSEELVGGFTDYAEYLERTGLDDPDARYSPQEWELVGREVRVQCMLGILLCLDREQRLVLIAHGMWCSVGCYYPAAEDLTGSSYRPALGGLSSPAGVAAEGLAARSSAAHPRPSSRNDELHRA